MKLGKIEYFIKIRSLKFFLANKLFKIAKVNFKMMKKKYQKHNL